MWPRRQPLVQFGRSLSRVGLQQNLRYSAGWAAACRGVLAASFPISSSIQSWWCSLAQLMSTGRPTSPRTRPRCQFSFLVSATGSKALPWDVNMIPQQGARGNALMKLRASRIERIPTVPGRQAWRGRERDCGAIAQPFRERSREPRRLRRR